MIRAPLQVNSCGKRTPGLRKALQTSSSQLRNMHDLARPAPQRRSFGRSADRHSRLRKRCVVVCAPSAALGRAEWPASAASGTDADAGDDGRRTRSGATAPGRLARCRCAGRRRRRAAGPLLATTSGGYGAAWCSVFTRSSHERGRCAGDSERWDLRHFSSCAGPPNVLSLSRPRASTCQPN